METSASSSTKTFLGYLRNLDESVESRSREPLGAYIGLWCKPDYFLRNENEDENEGRLRESQAGTSLASQSQRDHRRVGGAR